MSDVRAMDSMDNVNSLEAEIKKQRSKQLMVGSVGSVAVSLAIVLIAMKKQPWWLKLVVFLLISGPITLVFTALVRASGVIKLSDEGAAALSNIDAALNSDPEPLPVDDGSDVVDASQTP